VKQFLEVQQRRFETDLITLKEKQEQNTASAGEKKTTTAPVSSSASATRSYNKEITVYGKTK
jgi:hypothetical protein